MIYKEFQDKKLSMLGFGGMRLPTVEGTGEIDMEHTAQMVDFALSSGVNYFDTAFFYHQGNSENVLGELLSKYSRDTWYLGDKWPGNFVEVKNGKLHMAMGNMGMKDQTFDSVKDIFECQLDKCGVEYFDFYMLHNVTESTFDLYTNEEYGIVRQLLEEKEAGRIKHFGISTHGRPETINKFLNIYDCFEFALLQVNYLDWSLQEANKKYHVLKKHKIPIFAMEPIRGGKLAKLDDESAEILGTFRPNDSHVSWAVRFLQSLSNMYVVVSGMSSLDQLKENIELFQKLDPLSSDEDKALKEVVAKMATFVPCTSCRYCVDICPMNLDIPLLISLYNEQSNIKGWYVNDVLGALEEEKRPQACIGCGACNPMCPQNIDIAEVLADFAKL